MLSELDPAPAPLRIPMRFENHVPVLEVPDDLTFRELRDWIRERIESSLPEIGGRTTRLDLGARQIQLFDVRRLIHLLRDEYGVEITGLYVRPQAIHRYAERELKLKLFPVDPDARPEPEQVPEEIGPGGLPGLGELRDLAAEDGVGEPIALDELEPLFTGEAPSEDIGPDLEQTEPKIVFGEPGTALRRDIPMPDLPDEAEHTSDGAGETLYLRRTLRSGASIRHDGDVLLFGDLNPGAQVIAGGNILVMGSLRGMAHAGAHGNEEAFVLAFELRPTQIRIARHIAIDPADNAAAAAFAPEVAQVVDGTIVIEPYRGRLRR